MPPFRVPEELNTKLGEETQRLIGEQELVNEEMPKHAEVIERARGLAKSYGEKRQSDHRSFRDCHTTPWYSDPSRGRERRTVSFQLQHHSGTLSAPEDGQEPDLTVLRVQVSGPHPTKEGELVGVSQDYIHFNRRVSFERAGAYEVGKGICMAADSGGSHPTALDSREGFFTELEETLDLIEHRAQESQTPQAGYN